MQGTVKWFNDQKGFGFIVPDNGEREVFVHYSAVHMRGRKTLLEGQRVEFEVENHERGPRAIGVLTLDPEVQPRL